MPKGDRDSRRKYRQSLPVPEKDFWEVGGASNFAISAARLGLRTGALGTVFMHVVLIWSPRLFHFRKFSSVLIVPNAYREFGGRSLR